MMAPLADAADERRYLLGPADVGDGKGFVDMGADGRVGMDAVAED